MGGQDLSKVSCFEIPDDGDASHRMLSTLFGRGKAVKLYTGLQGDYLSIVRYASILVEWSAPCLSVHSCDFDTHHLYSGLRYRRC